MPPLNWSIFASLPGAATTNFEMLCRALIRRHYGRFGAFRAFANQPGVEFHLRLNSSCELGNAGRWFGWQCRWYDLPSGRPIGGARRRGIKEAIAKTEEVLPGLTDWILWTRHPLTAGDQKWFCALKTRMQLHLWTGVEVEEYLSGPGQILRVAYFGELVLTPRVLGDLHTASVAHIKRRWLPEVHQVVDAERSLQRALGATAAWSDLSAFAVRLEVGVKAVNAAISDLSDSLRDGAAAMVASASALKVSLVQSEVGLDQGDYEVLCQELVGHVRPTKEWNVFVRRLRATGHPLSLHAMNLLADLHGATITLDRVDRALSRRLVAVVADAGCGKTQLAAQLTAASDRRPAGILLHGRDLHARQNLNDLARRVTVNGVPVQTFEALVAAVDAAGQRAHCRLPIVIDGLNEAEDPRDWKAALASMQVVLEPYPYVLVVCTLRSDFLADALPDDVDRLEVSGFEHDADQAIARYFQYYRIDPSDASFPWRLLHHPLTLRIFCEVTNPKRERIVGVEAMPTSLTALFEQYLEQVAERIRELAPRSWRYFESDIRSALNRIGLALWEARARSIDMNELRKLLNDDARQWDRSIVRALEHDGVLIRMPAELPSSGHVAVIYDALAGHIVADALIEKFAGDAFQPWLEREDTAAALVGEHDKWHPLATDILRALVGLVPRRMHRRQLWPLLEEPLKTEALQEAAWLEAAFLDSETVAKLAALVATSPTKRYDLLDRLWITRAARSHPLDAEFLDTVLRGMSMPDRDLRWTEWVRRRHVDVLADVQELEERWKQANPGQAEEKLRARWILWTLTSTVRQLRDHATRALYRFGCGDPSALFDLTLDSLALNDPYVPERMLAACYGIAMSLWADPHGDALRAALPGFASALIERMFISGARHATRHVLMRDSALGIITLASRVSPGCISKDKRRYLIHPFKHLPSPFTKPNAITEAEVAEAEWAIHMDFGNYTIGRLIPGRENYDDRHPTYKQVRRQIEARIVELGYASSRFKAIDKAIAEATWRPRIGVQAGTDRYGKKYSWIAYFEMYGLRLDQEVLDERRAGTRTSDVDIDPSFPEAPHAWMPALPDLFVDAPTEPRAWIVNGPTPDYNHLLNPGEVDSRSGPWALLEGYIEQAAPTDDRRIFTFLRGVFVSTVRVQDLLAAFNAIVYPGNAAIPEPAEDFYTYAGEIPWSDQFDGGRREPNGDARRDQRDAFTYHDGSSWRTGIPVEVPAYRFAWESYHSQLNQVSGIVVPAPALCQRLSLVNRQGEWDLYDSAGNLATMYREFKGEHDIYRSQLAYIRCDLLANYLKETRQILVWMVWGERGFHHRTGLELRDKLRDLFVEHLHIHRASGSWRAGDYALAVKRHASGRSTNEARRTRRNLPKRGH